MKYPVSLSQRVDEVVGIVNKWPVEKDITQVLNWLMQFDNEDIDLGIRIIKNLNVIGFEDLNIALTIAYSKLQRLAIEKETTITAENTIFAGIGDGGKSGAMIGYNFRLINNLSEENFMNDSSIKHLESRMVKNIVLVDDVVGTGKQATTEIKKLTDKVTPFGVKNIFLLTAVGMKDGIKQISDKTKAYVFSAFEYTKEDTVTCLDSPFYTGIPHEERNELKKRIEYYGRVTYDSPLGYGDIGALIVFYYNTPNISLPIIWGSINSWIPLFKRAVRISGINSYYEKIELSIKNQKNKDFVKDNNVFFLLVEGKADEVFIEFVVSSMKKKLINITSLGGSSSKKLIDNILMLNPRCLFIIEEGDDSFSSQLKENIGNNPYIEAKPFVYYLDFDLLKNNDKWVTLIPEGFDTKNKRTMNLLEKRIKMKLLRRESRLKEFISENINSKKVEILCQEIVEKMRQIDEDLTNHLI